MGVDFNNGCYVSYNFYGIYCGDYGCYANKPCSEVIKILTLILELLTMCDYWPMTQKDINNKKLIGDDWYWGHGDKILNKSENYIKGLYYHMSYADIINTFLSEAKKCGKPSCKCWHGDSPRHYKNSIKELTRIKAAIILQRKFYSIYVLPRILYKKSFE